MWKMVGIGCITLFLLAALSAPFIPYMPDWVETFIPAGLATLRLQNPYEADYSLTPFEVAFFNPPWVAYILAPLTIFPIKLSSALAFWVAFGVYAYTATPLSKGDRLVSLLFVSQPLMITSIIYGNIDWLPLVGLWLPAPVAMLFFVGKPQIGIGLALYTTWMGYKHGGWRGMIKPLALTALLTLISFLLFGFWVEHILARSDMVDPNGAVNLSLFPYSIPIGVALLWWAQRQEDVQAGWRYAILSSLFFSPYFTILSVATVSISALKPRWLFVAFWLFQWAYVTFHLLG